MFERRRRYLPTSSRVALAVSAVLAAGLVLVSAIAYFGVSRGLAGDTDRTLLREAEAYAGAIADARGRDLVEVTRAYLSVRTGAESGIHPILLVRFSDGRTLSNSSVRLESAPQNRLFLDLRRAARGFGYATVGKERYRIATVPVRSPSGTVVAIFEAGLPESFTGAVTRALAWTLAGASATVLILGFGASAWAAQTSLGPLRRAAATAAGITDVSLMRRVAYEGPDDEVGRLVGALNGMLDRLEIAFAEQRRFVADASHELRTPLAVIRGHLELAQRPQATGEERAEAFAIVNDELGRMTRLVDDLLLLARLEAGPQRGAQAVELSTLVEEAVVRARALAAAGGDVAATASGTAAARFGAPTLELSCKGPLWVMGDPDQLLQALLNLLQNALAHSPADGVIRATCRSDGRDAVVEIADRGPGIRGEDLARLFDRFYRAPGPRAAETGGSGLGLAIVKRLIELHGGTVSAANRAGGGSVFTVSLPRVEPPANRRKMRP